jgi:MFS family permease
VPLIQVLADRDFRAIWYVGGVHEICRRMELFVLTWLIFDITGSPFSVGLVLAFNNLPRPIFSLFAGLVADRFSRRKIIAVAQIINTVVAVALLALILKDMILPWHAYLAVCLQGLTKALDDPARRTSILDIVGEGRIVNALSVDQISNTLGKMIGPLLGGALVALPYTGYVGAYVTVLVAHIITLALITRLHIPNLQRLASQMEPVWTSLSESVKYAFRNQSLLAMLYITIIMNALAFPVQQYITVIGKENLGVGAFLVGVLTTAEGWGQLTGAALMAASRNVKMHGRIFAIGSTAVLIMVMVFVWSPWYSLAFLLLVLGGVGQAGFGTMQSSITMLSAPREMRGRMVGLMSFCIGVGTPVGAIWIGYVALQSSTQLSLSANAFAGLLLILPAVIFTPLVKRPTEQLPA